MKKIIVVISLMLTSIGFIFAQFGTDTASYYIERAYTELSSRDLYSVSHWILGECRSDNSEVGGETGGNDIPFYQDLMLMDYQANNDKVRLFWYRAYNIVYLCNKTIEIAPTLLLDESVIKRYIAEARFIRSLMFFELSITFDTIPILTDSHHWRLIHEFFYDYDPSVQIHERPNTMAEVFALIEADLIAAIDNLPSRSELSEEDLFRATKGAARALLAKMYIFQSSYATNYAGDARFTDLTEKWIPALQYAEQVINSGEYELVGISGETYDTWWDPSYLCPSATSGYRYIFTVDGNYSPEAVFAATNLLVGQYSSYGNNDITIYTTCRSFLDTLGIEQNLGWGLNLPTQSLIDEFAEESGNEKDDPRFAVTVAYEGDSIYTSYPSMDWHKMVLPDWATGSACRKFECSPGEFWDVFITLFDSPMNIPIIRYADVVLWAAEAAIHLGDFAKASYYVNLVRTRARNSGSTGYPADLAEVTLEDIIHERRLELALEGHRFYDLVRWNIASDKLDGLFCESHDQTITFTPGTHEFLPIPEAALGSGVNSSLVRNYRIYANPASDLLHVESDLNNIRVAIYDISGKKLLSKEYKSGSFSLNIDYLSSGLYFLSLESGQLEIYKKFIKE
ncbi:MAG: RagB/SusD family nutrient uptake outer membrane protein [Bacteroidales bacterium]|nr:MAG: RagB/SusD family nutrient uptake outer membrane protein [Bacteroidales bacterium]